MGIAILDIDGTLVDTNYQHALAWFRAFRRCEIVLPAWRIHRHIGMGGDQLVEALTDGETETQRGDEIRARQSEIYMAMIEEVQPMAGSRELIEDLRDRAHTVLLASSADPQEVEHYLDLLDARELAAGWTTAEDVQATKPAPDLVRVALERADARPEEAVMIGDTPWDVEAAQRAGVPTLAVLSGGFSAQELTDAGARQVFESVDELRGALAQTPLA
jgi:HAD superfamily hydrolase (TIGR01509 family)